MIPKLIKFFIIAWAIFSGQRSLAESFLPSNNLRIPKESLLSNLSDRDFYGIINKITMPYYDIAWSHGAELRVGAWWDDDTVNASATQRDAIWEINFYGGLARHPMMTRDGFALVICHELGHHFAGYPLMFKWGYLPLSVEGNADYYATHHCLREAWQDEDNSFAASFLPATMIQQCNAMWSSKDERELCYRIAAAGLSAASVWANKSGDHISFDTFDPFRTSGTYNDHPDSQCRLDTYRAGALCRVSFDKNQIPGKDHPAGQRSADAREEAFAVSCTEAVDEGPGARPRCWFDPNDVWKN
jgi:hypothetical protein